MSYEKRVPVGGDAVMSIPDPWADPHIEWQLRYSRDLNNAAAGRFSAAEMISGYSYLLSTEIPMTEATRRLRLLRAAYRDVFRVPRIDPKETKA